MDENENGMTYKKWMWQVNVILNQTVGIGVGDLADCMYPDMWSDGCSPEEGAEEALSQSDAPNELIELIGEGYE